MKVIKTHNVTWNVFNAALVKDDGFGFEAATAIPLATWLEYMRSHLPLGQTRNETQLLCFTSYAYDYTVGIMHLERDEPDKWSRPWAMKRGGFVILNRAPDILICFLRWAFRERPSTEITIYAQTDHFSWVYHDVFHALHHTKRNGNFFPVIHVDKYCEWEAMRYGFRATLTEYDGELPPAEATMFDSLWKEYKRRFYWLNIDSAQPPTKEQLFGMDF